MRLRGVHAIGGGCCLHGIRKQNVFFPIDRSRVMRARAGAIEGGSCDRGGRSFDRGGVERGRAIEWKVKRSTGYAIEEEN